MAIPLDTFTTNPQVSGFLPPLDDVYDPLTMRATGGAAIGDGSQGREVQFWTVFYDGAVIHVEPALSGIAGFTLAVADVLAVCLAFDANMAVVLCYMKADGAYLYFFNGVTNQYETLPIAGATSCRIAVDKTTPFFEAASDVIFAYVLGGVLYWRQQRDRYAIEYTVNAAAGVLIRLGPSLDNRLQFQLLDN